MTDLNPLKERKNRPYRWAGFFIALGAGQFRQKAISYIFLNKFSFISN
jgi:hypothetical protein